MGTTHGKSVHYLAKNGLVDAELVAVCDPDDKRRSSYARAARTSFETADPAELIDSPDVNTVYVCTPTGSHRALCERALAAGKALFCEKPLAFDAADAKAIAGAARRAGVTHQVGLVMRFSAVMNVTRALVQEPASGRPMTAVLIDDQFWPIQGYYASTWRAEREQVGAGTLLEHAIHDIDILMSFFGPVRRVHGVLRNFAGREGIEDLTNTMLEFESGAVASHVSIWHNILHRGSSRRMTVACENAQFMWDDNDWSGPIRVESQERGGRYDIRAPEVVARHIELAGVVDPRLRDVMNEHYAGYDYLLENYAFLTAVAEGRPAFPDFSVAVEAHRVVDAVYESARAGRPVDVAGPA
jgi:predicted dehydrogenase